MSKTKNMTKQMSNLSIKPVVYYKRRKDCPLCGKNVVAHKLRRHQLSPRCQLATLRRQVAERF